VTVTMDSDKHVVAILAQEIEIIEPPMADEEEEDLPETGGQPLIYLLLGGFMIATGWVIRRRIA
jgi:LPXTG-motif cell wall-anchored protein